MAITGTLTGNITMTDNLSGSVQLAKALNFQYVGTIFEYSQSQYIGTTATTVNLPLSPTQLCYIKNLSTSATVSATWTPQGGSSASIVTLQPGSMIAFTETNATSGISALSITASASSTPIEYILLG
jgi:hypothetical protein